MSGWLWRKVIELEEGWKVMEEAITKLQRIVEGLPEPPFNSADYIKFYTTIYNMSAQKSPHDYSQQLYDKYKHAFVDYINSTVLPSLREKHDEFMLRELVKRWSNHKFMVMRFSHFFHYLVHYLESKGLPSLKEAGLTCFRDLVYQEISGKAKDAVIALIDKEREGKQVDRALLKNVVDIYVEIGLGQMEYYEKDFETHMLEDTAAYYSRKASSWIVEGTGYMLKFEECLRKEKDRVAHYLHSSSEQKLLEALKEAFGIPLNKGVAGSSSAELLQATFCDNILTKGGGEFLSKKRKECVSEFLSKKRKKGGSERLSDEAIEGSLEKVTDNNICGSLEKVTDNNICGATP